MAQNDFATLITYIEENLRASRKSGLQFVDTRHFLTRLNSKQNHVIFGRRGAGKTLLLQSTQSPQDHLYVYLNLEDYKDITFPNIVINVLVAMFDSLESEIRTSYPWWRFNRRAGGIRKRIKVICSLLTDYAYQPNQETQEVSTKESYDRQVSLAASSDVVSADAGQRSFKSKEVRRSLPKNKLDFLRLELTTYKKLLIDISSIFSEKPIFLVLDDFYFVSKEIQPELIDYFHRLSKGTGLYLKVATIKYRSKLYTRYKGRCIGVEPEHDILEIDMDYTLDNFEDLKAFMHQLLDNAISACDVKITTDGMFAGDGFSQLCIASGGVPRDLLSLFVKLSEKVLTKQQSIGKLDVTNTAILNVAGKIESINRDSGEDDTILEDYLDSIKKYVFDHRRTNAFLVAKDELGNNPQLKQAIHELVDLRLIHVLDQNTSKAPSDGLRYEAYMLDVGLYNNPRQLRFTQIEPGRRDEKSRKDDLRGLPVLSVLAMTEVKKQEKQVSATLRKKQSKANQLEMSFE